MTPFSVKKLDTTSLQKLLRCGPKRIRAEEASPEAIEMCRMAGVELLLSPGASSHIQCAIVDIGYAGMGLIDLANPKNASSEEVEKILSNTATRICFVAKDRGGVSDEDLPRVLAAVNAAVGTSENHEDGVINDTNKKLLASGYIPGQTYEQCLEMAKWHPGMAEVMKDIPDGQTFELVKKVIARAIGMGCLIRTTDGSAAARKGAPWMIGGDLMHHRVVLGKSGSEIKDADSLASELHEACLKALSKHQPVVGLAVSREMYDRLSEYKGSDAYLGSLHTF
ncbi:hypothetical protein HAP94_23990 [Acidithiobacillus ferrivorans]|nr:hypothetical protein [Acidithiobacillus ferrivorans]